MGGVIKDRAVQGFCRLVSGAYLRVRVEGGHLLPSGARSGYLVCFNHPSWTDPLVLLGWWPGDSGRFWIFGPRERDMRVGARNALIRWSERGVPFQPAGADIGPVTRRTLSILRSGGVLAVAGEGRLSDAEGKALPMELGVAHFALRAGVPIVPVAISGTRRIRMGKTVRIRIGTPIPVEGRGRGRRAAAALTSRLQTDLQGLLDGLAPHDDREPGRFGAWLSEIFNERPWLEAAAAPSEGVIQRP